MRTVTQSYVKKGHVCAAFKLAIDRKSDARQHAANGSGCTQEVANTALCVVWSNCNRYKLCPFWQRPFTQRATPRPSIRSRALAAPAHPLAPP